MSEQFVAGVYLSTEVCCRCGMTWAMPTDFQNRRRKDRENFYCPAGHPQHYTGETSEQKLQRELDRKQQMLEAERARAARIEHERNQVARAHRRMRERVFNGVCPCCNRTFQNLLQHMKTEHAGELNLANVRQAFGMTQQQVAEEIGVSPAYVSRYENRRPVPGWAGVRIEGWLEQQAKAAA
jgi:DNA-binding XRE family transcriptional regulator